MTESRSKYIPPLTAFAVAFIFALPILLKWSYIGPRDWELFITMAGVPVRTVLEYGQFPFWNPYIGGGNILFAHPEAAVFSPFFLILLLLGPIGGLKIQVLLCWWLGFWGSYRMARSLGLSQAGSWLVSFTYFGSSYFALHFAAGHMPFTHFCFLPWFVHFLLEARENGKYLIGATIALALMILGNGAAVPFLYTGFFAGLFAVLYSVSQSNFRVLKLYIVSIILGVLIAAVKFIPMFIELSQAPWSGESGDFTSLSLISSIFFSFDQYIFKFSGNVPGHNWPWHEYGAYLSPLVFVLGIYALYRKFKQLWIWGALGIFFLIFSLGHFSDLSLWNLFSHLPGFESIRAPGRAFQFTVLSFGILGGFGLDFVVKNYRDKIPKAVRLVWIIPVLVIAVNFGINYKTLNDHDYKKPADVEYNEEFHQEIGSVETLYRQFQRNRGCLVAPWLSAYKASRGIVTPNNEVMMEYFVAGQGFVTSRKHTPNRVEYCLRTQTRGSLVLSVGYDEGWRALDGRRVYSQQGLVTVDFRSGEDCFELVYRTPGFYAYLAISLIFLVLCLLILLHPKIGERFKAVF